MTEIMAIPCASRQGACAGWVDWLIASRSHRVMCLLVGMWVINGFDVVLTVFAHSQGMLEETNPIARALLGHGPFVIGAYKIVLVTFASTVLYVYRHVFLAELAAGGVLCIYTIVALQWRVCYELYVLTHSATLRLRDIDTIDLAQLLF